MLRFIAEEKPTRKILIIEGEPGIGKTLLADKLYNSHEARECFPNRYRVSAYNSSWSQIIRTLGYEILGAEHTRATAEELQKHIVRV